MCFSATASLTAGAVLSIAGLACMASAPDRRALPLAAMPLLFGIQQAIEGGLWLALETGDEGAQSCFATGFSAFSQVLWPLYVPLAAWMIETNAVRRRWIAMTGLAGLVVGLLLAYGLVTQPMLATIDGAHIHYRSVHIDGLYNAGLFVPAAVLYVVATCVSLMLVGDPRVQIVGALMLAAFGITYVFYETWLVSVWCFLAAVLSLSIWRSLKRRDSIWDPALQLPSL